VENVVMIAICATLDDSIETSLLVACDPSVDCRHADSTTLSVQAHRILRRNASIKSNRYEVSPGQVLFSLSVLRALGELCGLKNCFAVYGRPPTILLSADQPAK